MSRSARRFKFTPIVFLCVSVIAGVVATSSTPVLAMPPNSQERQFANVSAPASDRITIMAIAVASSVAICLGANKLLDRPQRTGAHQSLKTALQRPGSISFNQASHSLQRKLLRLLHDDRPLAERLFTQATLKYSGNTPNWYVEKVIYDLSAIAASFRIIISH